MADSTDRAASAGGFWSWKRDGWRAALIFLIAFAAFANTLPNGFVYDDLDIIRDNTRLDHPWDGATFFSTSYWGDVDPHASLYRPLTIWSFAIDRAVFGEGPFGVHVMNVLANALIAVLGYALILRLAGRRDLAVITALLFAIHPVHTEVVAGGVGRSELYAAIAMLIAILLHLRHIIGPHAMDAIGTDSPPYGGSRRYGTLAAAVAFYFIAMLFKESAAVLPGLIFGIEWLFVRRGRLRTMLPRLWTYLLYALPLIAFLAMRAAVITHGTPAVQEVMAGATAGQRILHALETIPLYVGQLIFPLHLCAEYSDYTALVHETVARPSVLALLAFWPLLLVLIIVLARKRQLLPLLGIAWFGLAMLPVSNLLFPIGTVRADRLLFFPSLGFLLVMGWLITLISNRKPILAIMITVIILGLYGWRTITRNAVWRDRDSLWTATVRDNPGSAIAWKTMGDIYRDNDELQKAADAYRTSFELNESAGFFHPETREHYGLTLDAMGDRPGTNEQYRVILEHAPRYYPALLNLGSNLLLDAATRPEAIDLLRRAIAEQPQRFEAYANLAMALRDEGRPAEALHVIDRAIALQDAQPGLWRIRADCLRMLGRIGESRQAIEEARRRGG